MQRTGMSLTAMEGRARRAAMESRQAAQTAVESGEGRAVASWTDEVLHHGAGLKGAAERRPRLRMTHQRVVDLPPMEGVTSAGRAAAVAAIAEDMASRSIRVDAGDATTGRDAAAEEAEAEAIAAALTVDLDGGCGTFNPPFRRGSTQEFMLAVPVLLRRRLEKAGFVFTLPASCEAPHPNPSLDGAVGTDLAVAFFSFSTGFEGFRARGTAEALLEEVTAAMDRFAAKEAATRAAKVRRAAFRTRGRLDGARAMRRAGRMGVAEADVDTNLAHQDEAGEEEVEVMGGMEADRMRWNRRPRPPPDHAWVGKVVPRRAPAHGSAGGY